MTTQQCYSKPIQSYPKPASWHKLSVAHIPSLTTYIFDSQQQARNAGRHGWFLTRMGLPIFESLFVFGGGEGLLAGFKGAPKATHLFGGPLILRQSCFACFLLGGFLISTARREGLGEATCVDDTPRRRARKARLSLGEPSCYEIHCLEPHPQKLVHMNPCT